MTTAESCQAGLGSVIGALGTVLVTGAAGRIGRVVVTDLRSRGIKVLATDLIGSDDVDVIGDICDGDFTRAITEEANTVVHLAGHPNSRDWKLLDKVNVGATRLLLDAAGRGQTARFIYASSVHAAGLAPADARLWGAMQSRPDSPYGVSKAAGEAALHHFCHFYGMSGVALRICAFRPEPTNARELRLWISPRDMAALVFACATATFSDVRTIWGVSGNGRADIARDEWASIGYLPVDDAERFVEQLRRANVDVDRVSEWPLLGGPVAITSRRGPAG